MNAPTIAPEIQQEAARSLLERLSEKTALVRFFRYNASAKHGVPIDPPNNVVFGQSNTNTTNTSNTPTNGTANGVASSTNDKATDDAIRIVKSTDHTAQPNQPNISVNVAAPPSQPSTTSNDNYLKGVLYTIVTLAGLGGAATLGYILAKPDTQQPVVTQPEPEPQPVQQSPLQFLEDIGAHLPESFNDD